jgi:hypothetical protein
MFARALPEVREGPKADASARHRPRVVQRQGSRTRRWIDLSLEAIGTSYSSTINFLMKYKIKRNITLAKK